ncbi:MAG: membrane protein insertase YidC [Propionibacteriaceae bacterium]|nr:membrane protein insertase YidC [Propionibacteriaceae bacterium]
MTMMMVLLSGFGDFFNAIMNPLYWAMSFVLMYTYKGWCLLIAPDLGVTWALAIMTLTIIVRTLLIPLFVKQINSARNMQIIQPKMKELQEKYGADRQRLGIEQQKLMKEEGVNPMASCFPLLLQMPVFIALYQVLYGVANNIPRGSFFVNNPDIVASLNQATLFGAELSGRFWLQDWSLFGPTQIMAVIMILAMTGLFFVTQKQLMGKNMPPEAMQGPMAQQQKMMLYMFPVMYLFIGCWIPLGVLVYWVTNNIWTLVQQYLLIRNNPTPGTPAYIEWEERMIKQGRDPKKIAEERRAKRSKAPREQAPSRPVAAIDNTKVADETKDVNESTDKETPTNDKTPNNGVTRQQIQRQQPARDSRAKRKTPKKKQSE